MLKNPVRPTFIQEYTKAVSIIKHLTIKQLYRLLVRFQLAEQSVQVLGIGRLHLLSFAAQVVKLK